MKSRAELEQEIASVRGTLSAAASEMDEVLKRFALQAAPDVGAWFEQAAIAQLQECSDKVHTGGIKWVAGVKADVRILVENVESHCLDALGSQDSWPHRNGSPGSNLYSAGTEFFKSFFKSAVAPLGSVIGRYELAGAGQNGSWKKKHGGQYEYAYHPGLNEKKYSESLIYTKLLERHQDLLISVANLDRALERAKVLDIWNEAD